MDKIKLHKIRTHGGTPTEIAKDLNLPVSTVSRVMRIEELKTDQIADRMERFLGGVIHGSGCYHGNHELLTEEQLHADDPLTLLELEEILNEN